MFVAERLLSKIIVEYGKHPVSTDGGTWYTQVCRFLKVDHHIQSSYEKALLKEQYNTSMIEPKVLMIIFLAISRRDVN